MPAVSKKEIKVQLKIDDYVIKKRSVSPINVKTDPE